MWRIASIPLVFTACFALAQDPYPVPLSHGQTDGIPFFNADGSVRFILPPYHEPVTEMPDYDDIGPAKFTRTLDVFHSGVCPVRRPGGSHYWIDSFGNNNVDFGDTYAGIMPFHDEFCLARKGSGATSTYHYLDSYGERAFASVFRYAAPFSEGYAPVNLMGEWGYIDKQGKLAIRPGQHIKEGITRLSGFHDGLALAYAKGEKLPDNFNVLHRHFFIDTAGHVVMDLQEMFPQKLIGRVSNFTSGIARVMVHDERSQWGTLVFIDKKGSVLFEYPEVTEFIPGSDGLAALFQEFRNQPSPLGYGYMSAYSLINSRGEKVHPRIDTTRYRAVRVSGIYDHYYALEGVELSPKVRPVSMLFSRRDNQMVYATDGTIVSAESDLVFVRHQLGEIGELVKLPGTVFGETTPQPRSYADIEQALADKDYVKWFTMQHQLQFPEQVYALSALQELLILDCQFATIPRGLAMLSELKQLVLQDLPDLTSLPDDLLRLPKLQRLSIDKCSKLGGIEPFIEKLTSLEHLWLVDYKLAPGFIEKMKKINPALTIHTQSSDAPLLREIKIH